MGDIKKCAYANCLKLHKTREINIQSEEFETSETTAGKQYFHKDCYYTRQCFLKFIDLWYKRIDEKVDFVILTNILKRMIFKEGRNPGYVVFALQYCIDNGYSLNYPAGFKYYVDREEIKNAYARAEFKKLKMEEYKPPDETDDSPKIAPIKKKPSGFASILKR